MIGLVKVKGSTQGSCVRVAYSETQKSGRRSGEKIYPPARGDRSAAAQTVHAIE